MSRVFLLKIPLTINKMYDRVRVILIGGGMFYLLGIISLVLAPFTGITVVTAAASFLIGWILDDGY